MSNEIKMPDEYMTPQRIRAWAREYNIKVGSRGRISAQLRDWYLQTHTPFFWPDFLTTESVRNDTP